MAFRPVHLAYLLVLLIVLESAVLYLKHPRSDTRKKAKHPGSKVHSTHRRGERRLAILTLGPSNIKVYAKRWGYDLIDVTKSVEGAASLLDAAHADPTFGENRVLICKYLLPPLTTDPILRLHASSAAFRDPPFLAPI